MNTFRLFTIVSLTACFLIFGTAPGFGQQQRIISYQGIATDANGVGLTGTHVMTFRIYASDTSTTPLYQETQKVPFNPGGEFDVLIGKTNALTPFSFPDPLNNQYYLGIQIENSGELTPRAPFSDVTRAFFADTAGVARNTKFADTAAFARTVDPSLFKATTVNGISPAVTIIGTGGTTVTSNGNTISINSPTSTGGSGGIQTIAPLDGTISVLVPSGPTTLIGIQDSSIITRKIAGGAVTNSKIASDAVTNDKVGSGTTTPGLVLTADGAGGTLWQSPTAQAITLPYSASASLTQSIFTLTNTGSGPALTTLASGMGITSSVTNANGIAIVGTTSDGGAGTVSNSGVVGTSSTGKGVSGLANSGDGVYASDGSTGNALHAVTLASATTAHAGYFENLGSSNSGNVLESHAIGTGEAGLFQISNAANASSSLVSTTNGTGGAGAFTITNSSDAANALSSATNGTGQAGNFSVTNSSSTTSALQSSTSSTAAGAMGIFGWASNSSGTGTGVLGQAEGQGATGVQGVANNASGNGTGVYGQTKGSGSSGYGVYGWASNTSGSSYGVWGQAEGVGADAMVGIANNTSGSGVGLFGLSKGSTGIGIYGESDGTASGSIGIRGVMNSTTTSGTFAAVRGDCYTPSANGFGVEGQVMNSGPGIGVFGVTGGSGSGVYGQTSGSGSGVFGTSSSASGYGIQGQNSTSTGVGILGLVSSSSYAIEGENLSSSGTGVLGLVSSTNYAIWGQNQGTGIGVYGQSTTTSTATSYGVYGTTSTSNTSGIGVYGQGAYGVRGATFFNGGWGVYGSGSGGTGYGVFGTTAGGSGYGVFGTNASSGSGTGVYAEAGGTGNCLIANYTGSSTSTTTANNLAIFRKGGTNYARIDNTGVGYFNGGTQNSGADVAEALVPTGIRSDYGPGDVLVLSSSEPGKVEKCSEPYSNRVSGVYATKPGVLLTTENVDANLADHVPMGVIGIVPTKVTSENGPISVGDLLVTSSTSGCAMKGDPDKLRFGNILGKAMEPFSGSGTSVIKVLVGKY